MGSYSCPCHKTSPKNINKPPTINNETKNNNIINNNINYDNNDNIIRNNNILLYNNTNINKLTNQYNNIKTKNKQFYDDIEMQEVYTENYKLFLSELNYQINNLIDHLNIYLSDERDYEQLLNGQETNVLLNEIEIISEEINEFNNILELQKSELKNLKNNYKIIQEQLNNIKEILKRSLTEEEFLKSINVDYINQLLSESEIIEQNLKNNKILYDKKRQRIEDYIKNIQFLTEEKIRTIKNKTKIFLSYNSMDETIFLKSSSLLGIKDFSQKSTIFIKNLIPNKTEELKDIQKLIKLNYQVKCYINDDCDVYDINYDLKAVGLMNMFSNSSFYAFPIDAEIFIILFEIDGKCVSYIREKYSIRFDIKLKNLESNNIHIIYKELPLHEKSIRSIYRRKNYGISHRLGGQNAKFNLINESNMEIINFEDEYFLKKQNKEYQWEGIVPTYGKETKIILSKKEAEINFREIYLIKTTDNSFINNAFIKVPFCYKDGNNLEIKFKKYIKPKHEIEINENKKIYEINFIDLKSDKVEFIIEGTVINKCKGEWIINFTNEEIESLIPQEFKNNKEAFKKYSNEIIKNYDEQNKENKTIVSNIIKIGKWVKQNIKYNIKYIGLNDITAMETYNKREGVCHHITKLFNALMYSLGYQVLYVIGFVVINKKSFSKENSHCWSLIKIDGKWLPFDATWGIFSGKLPVSHIFKRFNYNNLNNSFHNPKVIEQINIKGKIS